MKSRWSEAQYQTLLKKKGLPAPTKVKTKKTDCKAVSEMKATLTLLKIPFESEYRFHPVRKFRFDIALVEHKCALEFEGIVSEKSRHTTITGYTMDTYKYNLAQIEGWKVLRYTALNYKNVVNDLIGLKVI